MAQTLTPPSGTALMTLAACVQRALLRAVICLALTASGSVLAKAQLDPYLLLQGPKARVTYRFEVGEVLEWRLKGEEELFRGRIVELFPESNAIRLGDLLLSLDKIATVRHARRSRGFKNYARVQGGLNLAIIGGATAFSSRIRERQGGFLIGAAIASTAMVVWGSTNRFATRDIGDRYVLRVAGGDLRRSDDPERG